MRLERESWDLAGPRPSYLSKGSATWEAAGRAGLPFFSGREAQPPDWPQSCPPGAQLRHGRPLAGPLTAEGEPGGMEPTW